MTDQDQETAREQPQTPPDGTPRQQMAWPPFQFDRREEFRIDGITVLAGLVARTRGTRAPRLWIAAIKGSDLYAGRGGFGTGRWRGRNRAVEDLFRLLRDRYMRPLS